MSVCAEFDNTSIAKSTVSLCQNVYVHVNSAKHAQAVTRFSLNSDTWHGVATKEITIPERPASAIG
jgi:hypothetical protein